MSQRAMVFALVAASHLAWLPAALALVPLGPDFQVNTYTTANQWFPAVAADNDGNFVVVWSSNGSPGSDNSDYSIQGQRYDAAGNPQGGQSQVNTSTNSFQVFPAVAAQGSLLPPNPGGFVVVWWDSGAGTDNGSGIQGRRYDSAGIPQGFQFQVNTYTTGAQQLPHVAADAAGNFVVVWESKVTIPFTLNPPGSIQGQRYDAAGVPQGAEFQVNTYTTGDDQIYSAVASDAAGNFVVVWQNSNPYAADHIFARRFDASGTPQGTDFQVDTYTYGNAQHAAVALDAGGNFVVAWQSNYSEGSDQSGGSIQARRYDASGVPQADQFQVNTYTTGAQGAPQVVASGAGDFIVVWNSNGSAGSDTNASSMQGQRYDSAGAPFGVEFQVNSYVSGDQGGGAIGADAGTGVVVAWTSNGSAGSDTSGASVQARQFFLPDTTTTSSTSSTSTSSTSSTTLPTTELLPGRVTIIKPGTLAKFVAKPVTGDTFTLPAAASVAMGGSLRIFDTAATAGDETFTLPVTGWLSLGPAGSNGYKYRGAGTIGNPCKVVLVRAKVIKGVCRGTGVTLTPPFTGDVGINLTVGTSHIFTYCAQFGGSEGRNDATLTMRRNAPAPAACP